jgi:hypothetical protein
MSEQPPIDPPADPPPGQPYPSYPSYPAPPPGQPPYGEPPNRYDAGEAFVRAFRLFGRAPGPYLLVALLVYVVAILVELVAYGVTDDSSAGYGSGGVGPSLIRIAGNIVVTLLCAALARGALDAVDGRPVTFGAMFTRWNKLQVAVASILAAVATAIGLALIVLPGLVLLFLLWFTNFFVVDEDCSAFDGLKRSVQFSAAHVGPLLLSALLGVVLFVAGTIACVVGLLVALPLVFLLSAQAFRELQGRPVAGPAAT